MQPVKVYVTISCPRFPDVIPIRRARNQGTWNVCQRVDSQPIDEQYRVLYTSNLSTILQL